ncbi:MAG: nicotinate (nicotinamide) nucleotide adenylyltransferase [Phycisphaerae bacterium]|nr:nicotinate (nicotinamide) nucleotide adenylyltransferase [Phycisphaerae bacterium]
MRQRQLLFGGTFDPVHAGHIAVAEFAAAQLRADDVVFIPAKRSPHKHVDPVASGDQRLAMLRLATAGRKRFEVSDCELRREEPSYTLDTVLYFRRRFASEAELFWLIGADMVRDLAKWYRVRELLDACTLCVMHRGGYPPPKLDGLETLGAERLARLRANVLETPSVDISSSEIRCKVASGEDVTGLLCPAVLDYIKKNGLYR